MGAPAVVTFTWNPGDIHILSRALARSLTARENSESPRALWAVGAVRRAAWDGGTRVMAMVSGGFIPPAVRGTTSEVMMHVADCTPPPPFHLIVK